jgi:hypothetical protein
MIIHIKDIVDSVVLILILWKLYDIHGDIKKQS